MPKLIITTNKSLMYINCPKMNRVKKGHEKVNDFRRFLCPHKRLREFFCRL